MKTSFGLRRGFMLLCLLALALCLLSGCAGKKEDAGITSLAQLGEPGRRIGVPGDMLEFDTLQRDYPEAKVLVYDNYPNAYDDVASGRLDAYVYARREMEFAMENGTTGVRLLDENYSKNTVAVGLSPVSPIPALQEKINAFLSGLKADGTLEDMYLRWVIRADDTMPEIALPANPAYHLRVGTTGTVMPYSYYVGTELRGYDIELAYRFAAWLGADVEFKVYDFGGIVAAAEVGEIDCIMSNLYLTPENAEAIPFSDPLFDVEITAMVRDGSAPAKERSAAGITSFSDLEHSRIGVMTGSIQDAQVAERFPDSERLYFSSAPDMLAALRANKIDSFACPEALVRYMMTEAHDFDYLKEWLGDGVQIGAVFPKTEAGQALCGQFNAFVRETRSSGVYEEIQDTWFGADESKRAVPELYELPGPNGVLRMAADTSVAPFIYVKDGEPVGIDVDMVVRFCREYGYGLEIVPMDFSGVLASVAAGKADFACCGIAWTAERAQSVLFSETYYESKTVMAVNAAAAPDTGSGGYASADELRGKTIACITGAVTSGYVQDYFDGDVEVKFFDSHTDMVLALSSGKIDAYCTDAVAAKIQSESSGGAVRALSPPIHTMPAGFLFQKGSEASETVRSQLNEYLSGLGRERLSALLDDWLGDDAGIERIDMSFTGENGHLKMAVSTGLGKPWCYVKDGSIAGFEMQLAADFCRAYGYSLEFVDYDFQGMLAAVASGKCDMAGSSILRTPERMEQMDYSETTAETEFVLVVSASGGAASETVFERIAASFEKTFLRESRWKLFAQGIGTTLLIIVLSILFGTALGFGVFLLCRKGSPAANGIARFFVWLVQGMPTVVLLMILYYIIFGSMAISGTIVAIIGFTLVFGSAVFAMLKSGVGAVDVGQTEAAWALGYTDRRAFFRVILPQALPHFFPAYKGEITAIIKATAIVGYVAVQDLTKMGDIVRSRTYDAFFPLIAVAVIYFILAGILTAVVNRLGVFLDPLRRKKEDVLKGVSAE